VGTIDQILEDDKARGKKQRHTAKRIFERLRDEDSYAGGYTIVKDYVRLRKLSQREMFVPLEHPPGDAQADFGEAMAEFLARGADPLEADAEPWATPLAWAEKMNRPEIVELLNSAKPRPLA
jgi:hypothetical protein